MKKSKFSLKKAIAAQSRNISRESKTISQAVCACIRAERVTELRPYFDAAGVPAVDASNSAIKAWGAKHILPLMPAVSLEDQRILVGLTADQKKAICLTEGDKYTTANIKGVKPLYGNCISDTDKRRSLYLCVEKYVKVPIFDTKIDKDGYQWQKPSTDATGKRRYETVKRTYYIADAKECAPLKVVREAFFEILGLQAAIIKVASEEAELNQGALAASQRQSKNKKIFK